VKILIVLVIVLLALGGLVIGLGAWWSAANRAPETTLVRLESAKRGDLIETVSAPGIIEPETKVSISSKISAQILELPFKEGQQVTKGSATTQPSLLVRLDAKNLEASLRMSQARYESQKAEIEASGARLLGQQASIQSLRIQLNDAERDLKRQQQLLESHDVSQSIVDQAQAKFDQLSAQIRAAEQDLAAQQAAIEASKHQLEAADADIVRAQDELKYTTIVSPIDGTVTRVNGKMGEIVVTGTMNNAGTVIMEVADLSRMILKARVDETSIAPLKVGQKATIRIPAYKDKEFNGVVQTVALANTEETRGAGMTYFKCEILIDTEGKIIPSGLNADVDIETEHHLNAIKIPSQAVLGRPVDEVPPEKRNSTEIEAGKTMATVVYRLIDGKAVITPVKIGASDLTHTEVISGLEENDKVIVGPYKVLEALKHDQQVKEEAPATQPSSQPATGKAG
jgi:HlyD family secretion protein